MIEAALRMATTTRWAIWHGDERSIRELHRIAQANCACKFAPPGAGVAPAGARIEQCGPHRMLSDQRTLDHFAFVASALVPEILDAEFHDRPLRRPGREEPDDHELPPRARPVNAPRVDLCLQCGSGNVEAICYTRILGDPYQAGLCVQHVGFVRYSDRLGREMQQ